MPLMALASNLKPSWKPPDSWMTASVTPQLLEKFLAVAMAGRGSFGNPWLFQQTNALLAGEEIPELPPLAERIDLAVRQIELLSTRSGEHYACMEARHQLPWYLHGVPHSSYYRQQLVKVETLADIRAVAAGIKRDLR